MYKSFEICLPNKKWKKCIVPLNSTVAEYIDKLSKEYNFDSEHIRAYHRGDELIRSKQFSTYSRIPNNGRIELLSNIETAGANNDCSLHESKNDITEVNGVKGHINVLLEIERSPHFASVEKITLKLNSNTTLWEILTDHLKLTNNPLFKQFIDELLNLDEQTSSYIPQLTYHSGNITKTGKNELFITSLASLKPLSASVVLKFKYIPRNLVPIEKLAKHVPKFLPEKTSLSLRPKATHLINSETTLAYKKIKKDNEVPLDSFSLFSKTKQNVQDKSTSISNNKPNIVSKVNDMLSQITIGHQVPIDRNPYYFTAIEMDKNFLAGQEIPDEFFVPNEKDMKFMMADLSRRRKQLEDAPLKTKEMLKLEKLSKLARYPKCLIRFHLSKSNPYIDIGNADKVYLQANFGISEPLSHLYKFVCESIAHDCSSTKIKSNGGKNTCDFSLELFTTPPRHIIPNSNTLTLFEESLYPNAIIFIGFKQNVAKNQSTSFINKTHITTALKVPKISYNEAEQKLADFFDELAKIVIN